MRTNRWSLAALLLALATLSACALLGKSPPLAPRYFTPEIASFAARPTAEGLSEHRLRLGRIQAGAHLRQRLAYRTSGEELGYYDECRWTERPEAYLRRALSRYLFEVRGITRATSGAAPTLDAELTSFEEVKNGEHRVRVQIVMSVDDAGQTSIERTITVERNVRGDDAQDPAPVVQALALALSGAVEQIGDVVVERLTQLPPASPTLDDPTSNASPTPQAQ